MNGMTTYFLRRLLLIPVTFIAITFLVYAILRVVPGGPIEQAQLQIKMAMMGEGGGGGMASAQAELQIPASAMEELKKYYHLDKSIPEGYARWLWGIVRLDFGRSYVYSEPVLDVIVSKFPISIYFGLIGYFASWLICVPLGVSKALRHKTGYDTATSVLVFVGYAIPGFVACLILMVLLGGGSYLDVLPLGGFRSENWAELGFFARISDQLQHTAIPVIGYVMGGFATMTILMKNSLLDNLGADYVRTAFAKGLSERRVVFVHAMRNSLIPLTVGIGHALGLLFAGSFLIEKTCNIPGMGLLSFNSVIQRDYPVILGTLVFLVLIRLTGNIFSDMIWAMIDPRIRFGK
ncbi:MAG TPA: peptide ABC transporter permease [Elusimicrobia bacterium]|nr:peptide ABC transporter permease [Elusimicrobiota bacterium]HAU89483.1 peptide ABC transporter permease [Elusimicrobiota bacterium]